MKTFKEFINENVKDILKGKSEEEIEEVIKNLTPIEKLKYISTQRSYFKRHIYMQPPLKVGKVNGTDAIITFYYNHLNEFYDENYLVFNLLFNEHDDTRFGIVDTKFDFTYINHYEITKFNHKGSHIHHSNQNLTLEVDDDYLEKILEIVDTPENKKFNDEFYKMKDRETDLQHKKDRTEEEDFEYEDLMFKTNTISDGKEDLLTKDRTAKRRALSSEERKRQDDEMNKIANEILAELLAEEEEKKKSKN